ncbi:hypothetical protein KJ903_05510 [Patescibacteria group bacterium]|nr:hypothetical protein [Patescibacteria group bacterium]
MTEEAESFKIALAEKNRGDRCPIEGCSGILYADGNKLECSKESGHCRPATEAEKEQYRKDARELSLLTLKKLKS